MVVGDGFEPSNSKRADLQSIIKSIISIYNRKNIFNGGIVVVLTCPPCRINVLFYSCRFSYEHGGVYERQF